MYPERNLTIPKVVLIMVILGFVVFSNGFRNDFVGDDIPQIVNNATIHSITNLSYFFTGSTFYNGNLQKLAGAYYKPLLMTYFSGVYTLFGPNTFVFHILQMGIHIAGTILLFLVFSRFFKRPLAFLLSLIFLIHPLNSEAVFYISDTQDVLFFFFGILALRIFINLRSNKALWWVYLCLAASILAKETGIVFLGLLLLYSRLFKPKAFLTLCGWGMTILGGYLWLRTQALGGIIAKTSPIAPIEKVGLSTRMLNIPKMIFYYLKTFIWPLKLSYSYNWIITQITFHDFVLPLIVILLIAATCGYLGYLIYKKHEGEYFKLYIFFGIWLVAGLGMHLQLIPLDVTLAERWFYLPMAGLLGLIGVIFESLKVNLQSRKTEIIVATLLIVLLAARTIIRSSNFRNEYTIDSTDINVSTDDYNLENGLASDLLKIGQPEEALIHINKSIMLNPYWSNYNTLGSIYLSMGEYEKARVAYNKSLTFIDYYQIYENLAGLTLATGNYQENVGLLQTYIRKYPQEAKMWLYLAILFYTNGNIPEARSAIEQARAFNYQQNPEITTIYETISNNKPLLLNLVVGNKPIRQTNKDK